MLVKISGAFRAPNKSPTRIGDVYRPASELVSSPCAEITFVIAKESSAPRRRRLEIARAPVGVSPTAHPRMKFSSVDSTFFLLVVGSRVRFKLFPKPFVTVIARRAVIASRQ